MKTSVKKNLYYEIKDKVFEERYDGLRVSKTTQKVKVYGIDSTKGIRARLIELLYERVNYHKDKFIAPILYNEMKQMEVKKNGKVEHSSTSHDDQVFSYLMAIYVWYDGQNLMERYGIMKNSLKTDECEDIEYVDLESDKEVLELMDKETTIVDTKPKNSINELDIDDLMKSSKKQMLFNDFERIQFEEDQKCLMELLQNPAAREAYIKKYHIDPADRSAGGLLNNVTEGQIPQQFFIQINSDDDEIEVSKYAGNLGKQFSSMFGDSINDTSSWK